MSRGFSSSTVEDGVEEENWFKYNLAAHMSPVAKLVFMTSYDLLIFLKNEYFFNLEVASVWSPSNPPRRFLTTIRTPPGLGEASGVHSDTS